MSYTNQDIEFITNARADFETFLSQDKISDCRAIIENLGELGYETEVVFLVQALNRHLEPEMTFEPHVDPVPPVLEDGWREESPVQAPASEELEQQHLARLDEIANA